MVMTQGRSFISESKYKIKSTIVLKVALFQLVQTNGNR